jgi:hypothetical protein
VKTYVICEDPGHGWLAVKKSELIDLGIADKISRFSYEKGKTVYLEEDQDMRTFILAFENKYGQGPAIRTNYVNKRSPIRSYKNYQGVPK